MTVLFQTSIVVADCFIAIKKLIKILAIMLAHQTVALIQNNQSLTLRVSNPQSQDAHKAHGGHAKATPSHYRFPSYTSLKAGTFFRDFSYTF